MRNSAFIIVFYISVLTLSCGTTPPEKSEPAAVIKPVKPESFKGMAIITKITDSAGGVKGDSGYFTIYYSFIPSDKGAKEKYRCPECADKGIKLFYDNRDSFHKTWIAKWKIQAGNEYPALRHETKKGDKGFRASYEVFLEPR